ncbi:TetR/AcrR family transcriptional regulator [Rhizobium skierniewicense]|nr:TetR/AcrR family transcriptional regulator [Rhizobium skierniewicense]
MQILSERKKQPDVVRRNLIDCAARIAAKQGLAAVSVQAVASAAGVTKGGLFHHFASKQALVEALIIDLLDQLDSDIDALISRDREDYGCFTRAYVNAFFADRGQETDDKWSALAVALIGEPSLRQRWDSWLGGRLARHKKTDDGVGLQLVRLAIDGIWLADLMSGKGQSDDDRDALRKRLIRAARKANSG